MGALKRKELLVEQINQAIETNRGLDPYGEAYLRWDGEDTFSWSRNWGETLYEMAEELGHVDWENVDERDSIELSSTVDVVVESFAWYTDDELEDWFYNHVQDVCGVVTVFGYTVNRAEALKRCDHYAWRELFLNWLDAGVMDVSAYEVVGEE